LGSTSLTTDEAGDVVARQLYYPFGETRWVTGTLPTDFSYTGQRDDDKIRLLDYHARFYDPYLNRWIQPDTIIPDPTNPQSLNRYAYVYNNALKYTDQSGYEPSGYDPGYGGYGDFASLQKLFWPRRGDIILTDIGNFTQPGPYDHSMMVVSIDSEDPNKVWVIDPTRASQYWHQYKNLDSLWEQSDVEGWVLLRVDTTPEIRDAAAQWAKKLAGWDATTGRYDLSAAADFVSWFPFVDDPAGFLAEGYYCHEVQVEAYRAQGLDITRYPEYQATIELLINNPFTAQYAGSIAIASMRSYYGPHFGIDLYNSPLTYVIDRMEWH
jgi:RHS repeat-associated protein